MEDISMKPTREAMEADPVDAGKEKLSQAALRVSRVWGGLGLERPLLACAETWKHKAVSPSKRL